MSGTRRIAELQNSQRSLTLRRAAATAHQHIQRAQGLSLAVSLLIAGLGMLTKSFPAAAPTVTLLGAVWVAIYATLVAPWAGRYLRISATLQEMLEVWLFDLPWNAVTVGEPLPEDEVSRLSRRFRGDEKRLHDYYLIADVPPPYDVLFCLEQNLAWGARVRRRFASIVVTLLGLWCVVGILLGLVNGLTVGRLIGQWFVPSLGLLLFCLDAYRAQITSTRERTRVLSLVRAATEDSASVAQVGGQPLGVFLRQVQDVLFHTRRQQPRLPTWFFQWFHDSDLADFRFRMQILETRFRHSSGVKP
jgi:hypothetical protein